VRVVDFPSAWGTGTPVDHFCVSKGELRIFGVLLDDGSNLFALIYPGGQRFARTAHVIDWGIEEAHGPAPRSRDLARVNAAWRDVVLAGMIDAGKLADDAMVAAGLPRGRDHARLLRREGWV
jgi:hypothetical protein